MSVDSGRPIGRPAYSRRLWCRSPPSETAPKARLRLGGPLMGARPRCPHGGEPRWGRRSASGRVGARSGVRETMIPDYIREQILHATPPDDCCVPPGAIPAVVEGHLDTARVATIGLNPHGGMLRRHYSPMGQDTLDDAGIKQVWEHKEQYFERKKYAYFGRLERILKECGASYGGRYDPTSRFACAAVSLDLARWATRPLWSGLTPETRQTLLDDGVPFFEESLRRHPDIELLLANGMTVVSSLEQRLSAQIDKIAEITVPGYGQPMRVFCGKALDRRLVGWNRPLSQIRERGMLAALATRVAEIATA